MTDIKKQISATVAELLNNSIKDYVGQHDHCSRDGVVMHVEAVAATMIKNILKEKGIDIDPENTPRFKMYDSDCVGVADLWTAMACYGEIVMQKMHDRASTMAVNGYVYHFHPRNGSMSVTQTKAFDFISYNFTIGKECLKK